VDFVSGPEEEDVLTLLDEGPLSPVAEERAVPQLDRALREEYEQLFARCEVRPDRVQTVDWVVNRLVAAKGRYAELELVIGAPWYVPGVIHSLESGQRFDRHLHNGDPLTARTTHVPAGRPGRGSPPFTWEASAQDALELKGLQRWHDWSVAGVMFKLEEYNGWGYRQFHPDVLSPYLWSFSQHYTKGKYVADGRFDPNAVSQQSGAAVLLRRMVDRDLIPAWNASAADAVFQYSGTKVAPRGVALQRFLNTIPGTDLEEDGKLGPSTSRAVKRAFGHLLPGDPHV
jgi:lysozyme family protein